MLHLVMLEPLEERYTEQWSRWIPNAINSLGIPFREINWDKLTDSIEVWDVLDVYGTCYWKNSQLNKIVKMIRSGEIKDGDELWFADLRFPGIEQLRYIIDITGINLKITWVLHAGTWDKKDFTVRYGMDKWATWFEDTLFSIVDEVHLGSRFHKEIILKDIIDRNWLDFGDMVAPKLVVTWLFFDHVEVRRVAWYQPNLGKDSIVVFPHRIAPEKQPEAFDKIASWRLKDKYQFLKTLECTNNKKEYYELLNKARYVLSFEGQETFGYSILECMSLGVKPIVFDGMSYKDTVPDILRTKDVADLFGYDAVAENGYIEEDVKKKIQEKLNSYMPKEVARKMFRNYLT